MASRDLARWRRLAPALRPDQWYDADGVFSGSATLLPDGTPLLLYTATMNFSRWGFYFQQQVSGARFGGHVLCSRACCGPQPRVRAAPRGSPLSGARK